MTETQAWGPVQAMDAAFSGEACEVLGEHGDAARVAVHRWTRDPDRSDRKLFLDHCSGSTLDVGCGPGRLVGALATQDMETLGIDISAEAVRQTRARGATAMCSDVFEALPGAGRWAQVLLADGNIGIGGDPIRLLRRLHELLAPGGVALVELDPPGTGITYNRIRLRVGTQTSPPFGWASVGVDAIGELEHASGLELRSLLRMGGRHPAVLARPAAGRSGEPATS